MSSSYRADIQGLRAVAVLAVMVFHLNPAWLPGGFVGVDIFLVISGYLISSILLHKRSKPEYKLLPTLSSFYSSRIKRIAPAYFSLLIVVSILAAVLFLPVDFSIYRDGLRKAAYFNSNNYFANFGDYFAPANHEQPLLHTWSLAIEVQFYLIAPFIYLLLPKRFLSWLLPLSIITLTAYAEYRLRVLGYEQATYYSLVARLPAFFLGAWVALLISKENNLCGEQRAKLYLSWLSAALIIISLFLPKLTGYFPGVAGLIPIAGAALIILLNANTLVTQLLSNKTMVWIGALSYSLYLWHWPVLAFMRYYTGVEILNWQYSLVFFLLTLALATASFYWIETPLRLKRSKKQIIGYASLATLLVLTSVGMKKINSYYSPESLPVEYTRYGDDSINCHGHMVEGCLRGDLNSNKEVLVLGDSHAAMLNHFFDYLGKELGFKARVITASSCVTIPGFNYQRIAEWAQQPCLKQIEEAKKYLSKAETVFIAASWNWHMESQEFNQALANFFKKEAPQAQKYIISQEPLLNRHPLRNQRFTYLDIDTKAGFNQDYLRTNQLLKEMAQTIDKTTYLALDTLSIFKEAPIWERHLIYYDEHHLNEVGAKEYAKQALPIISQELMNAK